MIGKIQVDDENLNHPRFADNIVLISINPQETQTMIEELNSKSKVVGLQINGKNTQVMFNYLVDPTENITLEGKPLKKSTAISTLVKL